MAFMKTKLKEWLLFFLIAVLGFGGFYFLFHLGKKEKENKVSAIKNNGALGKAKIIRTGYLKGSYVLAEFSFHSKTYQIRDFPPSDKNLTGLSFVINFDSLNPQTALIDFTQPLFEENVNTGSVTGMVEKILDRDILMFSYDVDGVNYNQFQKYDNALHVNIGSSYDVIYEIEHPEVSYLKIN